MTLHGAKGLEWPLVVLTELEAELRDDPFGAAVEADGDFDWRAPLMNRWIRYWPWPYGAHGNGVGLDAIARATAEGRRASQKACEEEIRLLYVGATRARDHLILAKCGTKAAKKIDPLSVGAGQPHVALSGPGGTAIDVAGRKFPARVINPSQVASVPATALAPAHIAGECAARQRLPLFVGPSAAAGGAELAILRVLSLGARIPITGRVDMSLLGEAIHAVFAADRRFLPPKQRVAYAHSGLTRWGVAQVTATDVIAAADRLYTAIARLWSDAQLRREVPIMVRLGEQLVSGRLDLLLDGPDWFVVIDHKTFPGGRDRIEAAALRRGGQLAHYAHAVTIASQSQCRGMFEHLPISGLLVEVGRTQ